MQRLIVGFMCVISLFLTVTIAVGGGIYDGWPVPHRATTHFAQKWAGNPTRYGLPAGPEIENRDGTYVQAFANGWMSEGRVYFHRYGQPTPLPTSPPVSPPTPTAIPTPDTSNPQSYLLALINEDRSRYGVAPLRLNVTQSTGEGACPGSIGHSMDMAESGGIWHVNDQYPAASFPTGICVPFQTAGENVGMAAYGNELTDIAQLDQSMMAEDQPPRTPGCSGSHACNIINPSYASVGLGVYNIGGATWITEDFVG